MIFTIKGIKSFEVEVGLQVFPEICNVIISTISYLRQYGIVLDDTKSLGIAIISRSFKCFQGFIT